MLICNNLESGDNNKLPTCTDISGKNSCYKNAIENSHCIKNGKIYKTLNNNNEKCIEVKSLDTKTTFYFNSKYQMISIDNTNNINSVYKCNIDKGILSSCEKSVQKPGELIYRTGEPRPIIKVCLNYNKNEQLNSKEIESDQSYETIKTKEIDELSGNILQSTNILNIGKGNVLLVKNEPILPKCDAISNSNSCKSDGSEVNYCMLNDIFYNSKNGSCKKITGLANSTSFTYFKSKNEIIDESKIQINSEIEYIYKCNFDKNGTVEKCNIVKRYVIVNDLIINCNGWSTCSIEFVNKLSHSCVDTKEGSIMSNGSAICIDDKNNIIELPNDPSITKYIMFKTSITSPFYGQNIDELMMLALTSKSATVVTSTNEIKKGYHQNVNVIGQLENALICCSEDGNIDSCHVINALNGYYLNSNVDHTNKPVIKCEKYLGCRKQFVDKLTCTDAGDIIKEKSKISICINAINNIKIDMTDTSSTTTYKSITSINASFPGVIEENESVIKIGTDGSVVLLDDGIHLNKNIINGRFDDAI